LKTQAAALQAARDQLGASQAGLDQADANVRKAQADTETAKVGFDLTQISSPIAGSVGDITLKVGDYVTTGQTLTTINQNNSFDLQIPIPISYSKQLRPGLTVQLLDPNNGNLLGSGDIYFVSAQANATAQTIQTRAQFSNPNGRLRDAQYVRARVIWGTQPGVLVPTEAVSPIGGQNFVYVATTKTDDRGKSQTIARQVPVTLGSIQGQSYQVVKGLNPGDQVIITGVSKLKQGAPIVPQENNAPPQSPQSPQP
jgi:RND family efflux transporter MFP subunit